MKDRGRKLAIIAQIIVYILAVIIIIQIIKKLTGNSWTTEDVILSLVVVNLTLAFGLGGYIIHLGNKIASVDRKLHGHIEWHRGRDFSVK